jgi:diphosphomevalonate decarboxylase
MIQAKAGSNIALIKYWGKQDPELQWPANSSLSMTLKNCSTVTSAEPWEKEHRVDFQGKPLSPEDPFAKKILAHLDFLKSLVEGTAHPYLWIRTENSFPADCGIASSASGMAALTVAALGAYLDIHSLEGLSHAGFTLDHLTRLARRGSGSACRSLHGGYVGWQKGSSPYTQKVLPLWEETHWVLSDVVVLINTEKKQATSRAGHSLAWTSPLFSLRVSQMEEKWAIAAKAIKHRDFETLGLLIEEEALSMHSVMLTSTPPLNYLQPGTMEVASWLREERHRGGVWAYFTIDAGPNLHILCLPQETPKLLKALAKRFPHYKTIIDETGGGVSLC